MSRLSGENAFDMDTYGILPAVGYRFASCFRAELEFSARTKKKLDDPYYSRSCTDVLDKEGNIEDEDCGDWYSEQASIRSSLLSLTAQCYIDIPLGKSPIQPFISVGAGGTRGKIPPPDDFDTRYNSASLSWNAGAGLSYIYDNRLSLDVMYRYSDLGKFKFNDEGDKLNIRLHDLIVGARFSF